MRLITRYWRRADVTSGAVFRDRSGGPLSQAGLYLSVRRRGRQGGIENLHAHVFRHCAASALLVAGMQEGDLRVLMGWTRGSNMVARYTRSTAVERAMEARAAVRLIE